MGTWIRGRAGWCGLVLPGLLLTGCERGVLDPAGPVAAAERQILVNSMAIMLTVVVPAIIGTLAFAWWFRAGNTRAQYRPNWAFSGKIELVVWAVPVMIVMLLSGVTWLGSHALDPFKPLESDNKTLEVQVVSLDWKWLFIYPEQGVASVNELVIPAGRPVHFSLTSASVMNAFFVPQLGSMIYTMGAMASQLHLMADKPGDYAGLSTHFSGDGFSDMSFWVRSRPEGEFEAWVAKARAGDKRLDDRSYTELAKQSTKVPVSTYGSVDDGVFHRVVSLALPPGPGPEDAPVPKPLQHSNHDHAKRAEK